MWDAAYSCGFEDCIEFKYYRPIAGYEDAYDLGWRAGELENQQNTFA